VVGDFFVAMVANVAIPPPCLGQFQQTHLVKIIAIFLIRKSQSHRPALVNSNDTRKRNTALSDRNP
jgi:hypothetical protein